jgi:hypothetical protein
MVSTYNGDGLGRRKLATSDLGKARRTAHTVLGLGVHNLQRISKPHSKGECNGNSRINTR